MMLWMFLACGWSSRSYEKYVASDDTEDTTTDTASENTGNTDCDESLQILMYEDLDEDGYGNAAVSRVLCPDSIGWSEYPDDCDDQNPTVFPFALEDCDGVDNDCDGEIDNRISVDLDGGWGIIFYKDRDNDGYGVDTQSIQACLAPEDFVELGGDCDDNNILVFPGQPEVCDTVDNNCDGIVDNRIEEISEPLWGTVWYQDQDLDSIGGDHQVQACGLVGGVSSVRGDCDDNDPSVYPNAPEGCDGQDNSCDGEIGIEEIDNDGDGYVECSYDANLWFGNDSILGGYDCDDNDALTFPGAAQQESTTLCSKDADLDGYGDVQWGGSDCNDNDTSVSPNAVEIAMDGIDQNCDGQELCPGDNDGDGFTGAVPQILSSDLNCGSGPVDCNDSNASIYPGASETSGITDLNCDGMESVDPTCTSTELEGVYYLYCSNAVSWSEASSRCSDHGYDFASVQSFTENTTISTTISNTVWIGFHDTITYTSSCGPEMNFLYVDGQMGGYSLNCQSTSGSAFGYQNWAADEPDNSGTPEQCVFIDSFGEWSDDNCGTTRTYLCEQRWVMADP